MPSATRSPDAASLFFDDARGCKQWLDGLAIANAPQSHALMLDALRVFNRAEFDPLERLKCLELMRDKLAVVQGSQRPRLFSRLLPLPAAERALWATGLTLLEEMETGYRRCRAEASLEGHAALMTQRTLRYIGSQMLHHAFAHRRFDPRLWSRLHRDFQSAESAGIASARVKDSAEGDEGVSSVMAAYAHAVLLDALGVFELDAVQLEFIDTLLRSWSRKAKVLAAAPTEGGEPYPLVVDLSSASGATSIPGANLRSNHRVIHVDSLARSIRRRIRALQGGEDPSKLALPAHAASLDLFQVLQRLHKRWCETPTPLAPARAPSESNPGVVVGFSEAHTLVNGGRAFEAPGKERELSSREKDQIAVFGHVREKAQAPVAAPGIQQAMEPWKALDVTGSAWRIERAAANASGIAVGRLAALRLPEGIAIGRVSALVEEADGRLVATVTLFAGKAQPVAVRDTRRAESPWVAGFMLPAGDGVPVAGSFVVPPGVAQRGRPMQCWEGAPRDLTVQEFLERGADFDRVRAR